MRLNKEYILQPYKKSKDWVKSPFRYAGGKFYALKHILPFLECVPHNEYREPFVGGGSVFFGKKKAKFNWINDLEKDLIDMYRAFSDKDKAETIIKLLENEVATPERHAIIKALVPKNEIEAIFKTYYLNRTSYCGIINRPAWGYKDGKSSPPENWGKFISSIQPKLQDVRFTTCDFADVINAPAENGRDVLLYLDPPYYHADQKRAYTKPFEMEDHLRLANLLKSTPYAFCLSYDNVEEVKELYSWAYIYELEWLYNTANIKGESRKTGKELIITNYKVSSLTLF